MPTRLPDIDQVVPLGPDDPQLIHELRDVLDRHGALERFGITLLHQHFDVAEGEVLVETVDPAARHPSGRGGAVHGRQVHRDPVATR